VTVTGAAVLTLWTHVWNPDVTVAALAGGVTIMLGLRLTAAAGVRRARSAGFAVTPRIG
jgi:hypothetical protein